MNALSAVESNLRILPSILSIHDAFGPLLSESLILRTRPRLAVISSSAIFSAFLSLRKYLRVMAFCPTTKNGAERRQSFGIFVFGTAQTRESPQRGYEEQ
jgi:hypothetical protein